MKAEPECTWNPDLGWLTPEDPCPKTHCAMRGRCASHVDVEAGLITCPSCIGKVKRKLATIEELYALVETDVESRGLDPAALLDEAAKAGVDSEAFNLIGPSASPEQWSERRARMVALFERRGWCDWPRPDVLEESDRHPYRVLGDWDMRLREQYGPQTDLFVTVSRARDYLTDQLAGPFPHGDEFEDFDRDISECLTHLEAVLHDSRAPEQGRPCPRCAEASPDHKAPRLRKRYARHAKGAKHTSCVGPEGGCLVCQGANDTWHCPDVSEHWWTDGDYRDRVASDFVDHAPDLPAAELAERVGVSLSTVRKWTARTWDDASSSWNQPRLNSRRRGPDGRKVYPVADAERLAGPRFTTTAAVVAAKEEA